MSYVWEYISEEDKQRIGYDELTKPFWRGAPSDWSVDRETGNFLLDVTKRHEDMRNELNYLFYWQGNLIAVDAIFKQIMHAPFVSTYELTATKKIEFPSKSGLSRTAMLKELRDAIECEKSSGGRSSVTVVLIGMEEGSV